MGKQSKSKTETKDSAKADEKKVASQKPAFKERPELPSVRELLKNGARDENDPPETFLQSLVLPGLLLLTFLVSLYLFHIAPIHNVRIKNQVAVV